VNYIRDYQLNHGVTGIGLYETTLHILSLLLAFGFLCNCFVHPVSSDKFCPIPNLNNHRLTIHAELEEYEDTSSDNWWRVALAWLLISIPLIWGIFQSTVKVRHLFYGE
jgi:hypothetical protein